MQTADILYEIQRLSLKKNFMFWKKRLSPLKKMN